MSILSTLEIQSIFVFYLYKRRLDHRKKVLRCDTKYVLTSSPIFSSTHTQNCRRFFDAAIRDTAIAAVFLFFYCHMKCMSENRFPLLIDDETEIIFIWNCCRYRKDTMLFCSFYYLCSNAKLHIIFENDSKSPLSMRSYVSIKYKILLHHVTHISLH